LRKILTSTLIALSLLMLDARPLRCQAQTNANNQSSQDAEGRTQAANANTTKAQVNPTRLDEKARKIKRVVEKVGVAGKLTLYLKNGEQLYGNVVRYDAESVQIAEVDLKQVVTIQYQNIKKAREDYGHRDILTGRRSNPSKGIKIGITAALLFVAVGLPIVLLASIKD
jgi:hypothetical protein